MSGIIAYLVNVYVSVFMQKKKQKKKMFVGTL